MAEQKVKKWFGTTDIKLNLNLTAVWVCVAALIVGILIYLFAKASPENRSVYVFMASALGFLTGIITLLARLSQGELHLEQARRTAALDFIIRWTDPKFDDTRRKGRDIYEELKKAREDRPIKSEEELFAELRRDKEKWANFVDVANFFETLGIAFHHKQVDERIVKDFFRGIIAGYWNAFRPVIDKRRAEQENPRLLQWFQALHDESGN